MSYTASSKNGPTRPTWNVPWFIHVREYFVREATALVGVLVHRCPTPGFVLPPPPKVVTAENEAPPTADTITAECYYRPALVDLKPVIDL